MSLDKERSCESGHVPIRYSIVHHECPLCAALGKIRASISTDRRGICDAIHLRVTSVDGTVTVQAEVPGHPTRPIPLLWGRGQTEPEAMAAFAAAARDMVRIAASLAMRAEDVCGSDDDSDPMILDQQALELEREAARKRIAAEKARDSTLRELLGR